MIRVGEIERTWVEGGEKGKEGKCTKQRKRACNGAKGVDEALWDGGGVGVVCDIACCKLQFCCEIIIKYIMPSRLLPRSSPRCSSTIPCPRPTIFRRPNSLLSSSFSLAVSARRVPARATVLPSCSPPPTVCVRCCCFCIPPTRCVDKEERFCTGEGESKGKKERKRGGSVSLKVSSDAYS